MSCEFIFYIDNYNVKTLNEGKISHQYFRSLKKEKERSIPHSYNDTIDNNIVNNEVCERKTILICDDEPDLLFMFKMYLESKYNVLTSNNGKECIEKFVNQKHNRGKKIDLILLDYRLDDMHGDVVASKIKEMNGTKIILITAYDIDEAITNDLIKKGIVVEVVKKPIDLDILEERIQNNMKI